MNETALKERLKSIAKEKGITFNECWKQLLLERLLSRISKSDYADKLVFKGGFLLSYSLEIGRETTDLDFLMTKMKAELPEVQTAFEQIAQIDLNDGFSFSWDGAEDLSMPHMNYPGFRISLNASLGKMKDKVQVDLGVGDAVDPENKVLKLFDYKGKAMFEGEITLLAYPLETIFAEKLETLISRGAVNSRMKDYHDLLLLSRSGDLDLKKLKQSIEATFVQRGTPYTKSITFEGAGMEALQRLWSAHLRGLGDIATTLALPKTMESILSELQIFLSKN